MTLRTVWRPAVLVIAVLLAACGEPAASGATRGPASADVSLAVSGGIAGVQYGIDVRPDGSVSVTDRTGSHAARDLSAAEEKKLDSLLAAVDFAGLPARQIDAGSRDRFEYRLTYGSHSLVTDRSTDLGPADRLIDHLESCRKARQERPVHQP